MSTILKALRRLEQERAKDAERPLKEAVVYARPRSLGPWGHRALIVLALVLGFSVTWVLLPPSSSDGDDAASVSSVATPPPTALPATPALPQPVAMRGAAAVDPEVLRPSAPFEVSAPSGESGSGSRAVTVAPTSEPAPSAPIAEPRRAAIETTGGESVIVAPIEGRVSRLVDEEPAPRVAHAEIPVHVVRTSWHPRAERRAAWVAIGGADPREVREGEWVGALEIRTIEPDGILFADGPILVHRRIGER